MTKANMPRAMLPMLLLTALAAGVGAQAPGQAEAQFSTGLAHLKEGRVDLAIEEIRKAIKEDPKNPYFYKGLGVAYMRKGKFDEAIVALRKALQLNPYYVDVHNDLGSALLLAGKRAEGQKEFLAAFGDPLNPTPEISAYNLGQSYFEEKNYGEAVSWFKTSISKNKFFGQPYLGVADALEAQGRTEEAMAELEAAVKDIPNDPSLLLALGEKYLKAGRFTDARAQLEGAVRKDPGGPTGQRAAGLLKDVPK